MSYARAAVVVAVLLSMARMASAQISVDEANRRLRERTGATTRPADTQPVGELARVTDENRRLRLRVAQLETELATLRQAMGAVIPATAPTTQRAGMPDTQHVQIAGTWRGGDINRGSGFLLEFSPDGTYRRTFLSYNTKPETGQFTFNGPITIEMWADGSTEGADHNEYRVAVENGQLTLTPTHVNGRDVQNGRPMVLSRAQ